MMVLGLSACPMPKRERGACSEGQAKPGYECGPWGRWTERCDGGQPCLPGESCQPSEQHAQGGPRWCAVTCGARTEGQAKCDSMIDQFGGRTECREIVYPHDPDRGEPPVKGMLCSDPSSGWGESGNDPEQADGSGG